VTLASLRETLAVAGLGWKARGRPVNLQAGVSLLDEKLFRPAMIPGHHKITDLCLLGLTARHKGKTGTGSQLPTAQFEPVPVLRSAVSI
jgi:hypothetical protein